MSEIDLYEVVRQKLTLGPLTAPKHEKIIELLKALWNEEEIKIISKFDSADKWNSLRQLEERTGIPKKEIKTILARSLEVGTIDKRVAKFCLLPILPGIFEKYFQRRKDTKENELKVAKLYRAIMKEVMPHLTYESEFKLFRPLLPIEAEQKLIEINKDFDVETQALPYELIRTIIDSHDYFVVIPCQCRLIGELSGEPCSVAPSEMGCFIIGGAGQQFIDKGIPGARKLLKEEAIEFIKETEKAGLVHNAVWDKGNESSYFLCNCCSCHCGMIYPAKLFHTKGVHPSNYEPKFNMELCTKCELCMRKCPNGAIYHKWPNESDSSDERNILRKELCIGCGVCAANCPQSAIKMVKIRDETPPERNMIGNKTFLELL